MTGQMMSPEVDTIILTAADLDIACDFITKGEQCDKPARWIMHREYCCSANAHPALSCTSCKDLRLSQDAAVECAHCGYIAAPARLAYRMIEALK